MAPAVDTSTTIPKIVELKSATTLETALPHVTAPAGATHQSYLMAIGFDAYNQASTGELSKTLNSIATDSDHIPVVFVLNRQDKEEYAGNREQNKRIIAKSKTRTRCLHIKD